MPSPVAQDQSAASTAAKVQKKKRESVGGESSSGAAIVTRRRSELLKKDAKKDEGSTEEKKEGGDGDTKAQCDPDTSGSTAAKQTEEVDQQKNSVVQQGPPSGRPPRHPPATRTAVAFDMKETVASTSKTPLPQICRGVKQPEIKYMLRTKEEYDKYKKEKPKEEIYEEVKQRSSESYQVWDKQAELERRKRRLPLDYVIAEFNRKILVKWTNYPVPTWQLTSLLGKGLHSDAYKEHEERQTLRESVREVVLGECNNIQAEFNRMYPNYQDKYEVGEGDYGYVRSKRARHLNMLRAWEWHLQRECSRWGLPPIYVENWTNDEFIPQFEFYPTLDISPNLKEMLENEKSNWMQESCPCEDRSRRKSTSSGRSASCGTSQKQKEGQKTDGSKGRGRRLSEGAPQKAKPRALSQSDKRGAIHECTENCDCRGSCGQTTLQRGRQVPLLLFRHPEKGWSVRAAVEIRGGDFIGEYAGKVIEEKQEKNTKYIFLIGDGRLLIDACKKGSESRFFCHSCAPNCITAGVYVERYGMNYHHIGFYTRRDIHIGEELTFDYYSGVKTLTPEFGVCKCGYDRCRYKAKAEKQSKKEPNGKKGKKASSKKDEKGDVMKGLEEGVARLSIKKK